MLQLLIKILLFLVGFSSYSQQVILLQGKVLDSLVQPLSNANIFAIPENNNLELSYAISDNKGFYKLKLIPNTFLLIYVLCFYLVFNTKNLAPFLTKTHKKEINVGYHRLICNFLFTFKPSLAIF